MLERKNQNRMRTKQNYEEEKKNFFFLVPQIKIEKIKIFSSLDGSYCRNETLRVEPLYFVLSTCDASALYVISCIR